MSDITAHSDLTNITAGYPQTNLKKDIGKTLKRWPVLVDHYTPKKMIIAFDGSEKGERIIHRLIQVKLLAGSDCYLVMHSNQDSQLKKAQNQLHQASIKVKAYLLESDDSIVDELCNNTIFYF